MQARIHVTLKDGVLDPQAEAIRQALGAMGFVGIEGVRQGKLIELDLSGTDPDAARKQVTEICEKLLANTVIEDYRIEIS